MKCLRRCECAKTCESKGSESSGASVGVGGDKRDKCGVFGIISPDSQVSMPIYFGLVALQHRGQEAAGIASFDGTKIRITSGMGLASQVFDQKKLQFLYGKTGIGHVRYSTTGSSSVENAQPFLFKAPAGSIALAFNGNILNYFELKEELEKKGHLFVSSVDTELIAQLFAVELKSFSEEDLFEACRKVMEKLDGAYSILLLTEKGQVLAFRDPKGFKPLCIGEKGGATVFSSETCALDVLDAKLMREIEPGEAVFVDSKEPASLKSKKLFNEKTHAHCMFEFVYFSRADSIIEGRVVGQVRENLGKELLKLCQAKMDVIVPVPDSGRSCALGFANASGVPFSEGLVKNRYVWRTFIQPSDNMRKAALKLKLNPVRSVIEGKRVGLVDDSIVRGNTMNKVVNILREDGAKEVHLLVSCPPVIAPCYMGVDFPTYKELIAANNSIKEIEKQLGVDSLTYMSVDGLVKAIGLDKTDLCMACLTDEYPTKTNPKEKHHKQ